MVPTWAIYTIWGLLGFLILLFILMLRPRRRRYP